MSDVILFCLCLWSLSDVFCVSVSVTEGESVTLSVNLTDHQRKHGISWKFGAQGYLIAEITRESRIRIYENQANGRFRGRLKLDQTGSLTITKTRITHSGLYEVTNTNTNAKLKIFNITVYDYLPVPVITNSSGSSSGSKCVVLCSVMNVSHVSLSWYKGKSLLSSISVSEHRDISSISLHLECLDDSYTCVINNSITNQTQHLNTDVCHTCSVCLNKDIYTHLEQLEGVFGTEHMPVKEGDSVNLPVNLTDHQRKHGISWKFGARGYLIAEITRGDGKVRTYEDQADGRFSDRLTLDHTGSLIITNITANDSGLYEVTNTSTNAKLNTFIITVHARLPVPVITNSSSLEGSSSSKCVVLCSVMDVSHVSLSWYKGKSLLSSISVSEHRDISSISLHLECLDDSYTCVINNSITNQTQHLNTDVCHTCSVVDLLKLRSDCRCSVGVVRGFSCQEWTEDGSEQKKIEQKKMGSEQKKKSSEQKKKSSEQKKKSSEQKKMGSEQKKMGSEQKKKSSEQKKKSSEQKKKSSEQKKMGSDRRRWDRRWDQNRRRSEQKKMGSEQKKKSSEQKKKSSEQKKKSSEQKKMGSEQKKMGSEQKKKSSEQKKKSSEQKKKSSEQKKMGSEQKKMGSDQKKMGSDIQITDQ
ncbi:hypothetical protein IRJ41_007212 [Triplophysa rosa]|uniref:Ig-like domain-containing protein n=1 Tax=Triplophysa rosa TaxID=992332 RepID=A0A9W7T6M3_TRIRA|nr:hypothetical protein IRJ41_007212 [Triplophysa rosa]